MCSRPITNIKHTLLMNLEVGGVVGVPTKWLGYKFAPKYFVARTTIILFPKRFSPKVQVIQEVTHVLSNRQITTENASGFSPRAREVISHLKSPRHWSGETMNRLAHFHHTPNLAAVTTVSGLFKLVCPEIFRGKPWTGNLMSRV